MKNGLNDGSAIPKGDLTGIRYFPLGDVYVLGTYSGRECVFERKYMVTFTDRG